MRIKYRYTPSVKQTHKSLLKIVTLKDEYKQILSYGFNNLPYKWLLILTEIITMKAGFQT